MIKEDIKLRNTNHIFITRICDECGKEEKTRMGVVVCGRRSRGNSIDLCRKCSCSTKYKPSTNWPLAEESHLWKGGRRIDGRCVRIYNGAGGKYRYEHRIIMESFLGRELSKEEVVHHIDFDGYNNNINNLYLFANEHEHRKCHAHLEQFAFSVFGKLIWFDRSVRKYVLHYVKNETFSVDTEELRNKRIKILTRKSVHSGLKLCCFFHYKKENNKYGKKYVHDFIVSKLIGRNLYRNEIVHHIDGNSLNNDINNLILLENSYHTSLHKQLQQLVGELYKQKKVIFSEGKYFV